MLRMKASWPDTLETARMTSSTLASDAAAAGWPTAFGATSLGAQVPKRLLCKAESGPALAFAGGLALSGAHESSEEMATVAIYQQCRAARIAG